MKHLRIITVLGLGTFALTSGMAACTGDDNIVNPLDSGLTEASSPTGDAAADASTGVESVPQTGTMTAPSLSAPVDLVRDEWGNPHIYGNTIADVGYVQGYVTAEDRLIQLEFERHFAAGRIAELAGGLSPAAIDTDIGMRMHHMEADGKAEWAALQAATDAESKSAAALLTAYAAGVNAYVADVIAGKVRRTQGRFGGSHLRPEISQTMGRIGFVDARAARGVRPRVRLRCRNLFSIIDQAVALKYGSDPLRQNLNKDFQLLSPQDPTTTINGFTGSDGTRASAPGSTKVKGDAALLGLLKADHKVVTGMGDDHTIFPERDPTIGSSDPPYRRPATSWSPTTRTWGSPIPRRFISFISTRAILRCPWMSWVSRSREFPASFSV